MSAQSWKGAFYKPGESSHQKPLLDFQSLQLREINICYLSHVVQGILLWQLKRTKHRYSNTTLHTMACGHVHLYHVAIDNHIAGSLCGHFIVRFHILNRKIFISEIY